MIQWVNKEGEKLLKKFLDGEALVLYVEERESN